MKLLCMILSGSAALIAVINGYADAVDANTVSAASDLQERMLNEQNNEPNGIGIITSPQHESKSGKSKSAKNGSNNVNVIDKVVAFAFGTFGFLGLANNNIINEEKSIDILTSIVRKANDLESAIVTIGEDGGMRRLQSFGTNNSLFLAYIRVSILKLQGLDDTTILDQLSLVFTERVVSIIAGVLGLAVATTTTSTTGATSTGLTSTVVTTGATSTGLTSTSSTTSGCPTPVPPTCECLPKDGPGTLGSRSLESCTENDDCFGCKFYIILSPLP